jgi:hypothetical protein
MPADKLSLEELHSVLGHYARTYTDLQKSRIGLLLRAKALERDGAPETEQAEILEAAREVERQETKIARGMARFAKQHFMADWIAAQPGIGLVGFALLLGVTGPLDRFGTVSKLWKYLGLHTQDGKAPRREKGQHWTHTNCQFKHLRTCTPTCKTDHHPNCVPGSIGTAYAPQGRVLCRQLSESIVKVGKGPYRSAYDQKKAEYEVGRPDWTQAHRHNAAMRYAVKQLVKALWIEWDARTRAVAA